MCASRSLNQSSITNLAPSPPFLLQDRIRAIANAMGLQTVLWKYDSNDWRVGQNGYTTANVDTSYQLFIANLTAGSFDTVGGIMLTHELNNYTMQEAVNWYPQLKAAFSVRWFTAVFSLHNKKRLTHFFFLSCRHHWHQHIVPIGVAMNTTNPYLETNYTLPTFQQCKVPFTSSA
jgi:hypothetical protein